MNNDALREAQQHGWPLTAQDILKERIEFEDRVRFAGRAVTTPESVLRYEVPSTAWKPTYGFVVQLYKFVMP